MNDAEWIALPLREAEAAAGEEAAKGSFMSAMEQYSYVARAELHTDRGRCGLSSTPSHPRFDRKRRHVCNRAHCFP